MEDAQIFMILPDGTKVEISTDMIQEYALQHRCSLDLNDKDEN